MSTKKKKLASYCAVISSSWVNGSLAVTLAVTRDPHDPSKNGDPFDPLTHFHL